MHTRVPPEEVDQRLGVNCMWLGEVLHIWRPAIYCVLLQRCGAVPSSAVQLESGGPKS